MIPFCPEQLGGQSTPRLDSEINNGNGYDVLDGLAKVLEKDGTDVTNYFIKGATESLKLAKLYKISEAILKERSPSCGTREVYDGNFSKTIVNGIGVTSALFTRNNITIISDEDI